METEKDVPRLGSRESVRSEPHLFVVLDGGRPTSGGLRCSLQDLEKVTVGRGESRRAVPRAQSRELSLILPDPKVSTCHTRFVRRGGDWRLEDAGSTNGTYLNGRRVSEQLLSDGDIVEVGQTILRLRLALPTPEGTPEVSAEGEALGGTLGLPTLVPALAGDLASLACVAQTRVPLLLLGDTGTGKELAARAVHAASKRTGDLVAVNCAALPDNLVEALFFGHRKGAFSGAVREELGFARAANGGTLFLDEIADLPGAAQGALLRVLQDGEVLPVGSTRPMAVDVRIIAATHQPIKAMVERGTFRRDLFARLQGFAYYLWPLADRREDIGLLVADHLVRLAPSQAGDLRIAAAAARALVAYSWPYNVRELVQVLARALPFARDGIVEAAHLPQPLANLAESPPKLVDAPIDLSPLDAALRIELVERLERCKGNVAAVAREMRKGTMQVYRWMQRLGIDPREFR
jgi:transcriptional regulator of acetoin/glycerol metabolism